MNITSVFEITTNEPLNNYTSFISMGRQNLNPAENDFMTILSIADTKKELQEHKIVVTAWNSHGLASNL